MYPGLLFAILPIPVDYHPFTAGHLIETGGIVVVAAVILLLGWNLFKPKEKSVPDLMEVYRLGGRGLLGFSTAAVNRVSDALAAARRSVIARLGWFVQDPVMATTILAGTALLPVARAALPRARAASLEEDLMRTRDEYPGNPARMWGTGYGLLLVTLFLIIYFIVLNCAHLD